MRCPVQPEMKGSFHCLTLVIDCCLQGEGGGGRGWGEGLEGQGGLHMQRQGQLWVYWMIGLALVSAPATPGEMLELCDCLSQPLLWRMAITEACQLANASKVWLVVNNYLLPNHQVQVHDFMQAV